MRCDYNMTQCESFDSFAIRDICRIIDMDGQLWSDFFAHFEPTLRCPIKKTSIKITDSVVDLGYIAHLPLSGYTWNFIFKVFKSGIGKRSRKQLIACITYDVTITKTRPEKRNKNG